MKYVESELKVIASESLDVTEDLAQQDKSLAEILDSNEEEDTRSD
jgi:hypothetical protein